MKRLILALGIVFVFMFSLSNSFVLAQVDFCEGNFDYDLDVDGTDAIVFKEDFGRQSYVEPCPLSGPAPVPKTGQSTSYVPGDDGDLQKGVAWPNPRFTDNLDGTVSDNLTGLIWVKNANCFTQRPWDNAVSIANELQSGQCELTDGSSAGDWRLPSRFELESLLDLKYVNPALSDTTGLGQWWEGDIFSNVQSDYYWSSTTVAYLTGYAWDVSLGDSFIGVTNKTNSRYVWPVRGGQ